MKFCFLGFHDFKKTKRIGDKVYYKCKECGKIKEYTYPCDFNHYKSFGESLDNMVQIVGFDKGKDKGGFQIYGYSIYECKCCGKRSFGCTGSHLMGSKDVNAIDSFIRHGMSKKEFKIHLLNNGFRCKFYKKSERY